MFYRVEVVYLLLRYLIYAACNFISRLRYSELFTLNIFNLNKVVIWGQLEIV